jgi:amino acid transporter
MFWFFYPFVPPIIYFAAGVYGQKVIPGHKFCTGYLVALPGFFVLGSIVVMQLLDIEDTAGFNLDTIILIMLIPTVLAAIIGSLLGDKICGNRNY